MRSKAPATLIVILLTVGLLGCGSEPPKLNKKKVVSKIELVNLDRVMDLFVGSLDDKDLEQIVKADQKRLDRLASPDPAGKGDITASQRLDNDQINVFLKKFTAELNRSRVASRPVTVIMQPDGTIVGFIDTNRNGKIDLKKGETEIFRIVLDQPRHRLVASDLKNMFHRNVDYRYPRKRMFSAHFLGAMLNRQQVTGFDASKLATLEMAPAGYHRQALKSRRDRALAEEAERLGLNRKPKPKK
jgi:hypothetical protein